MRNLTKNEVKNFSRIKNKKYTLALYEDINSYSNSVSKTGTYTDLVRYINEWRGLSNNANEALFIIAETVSNYTTNNKLSSTQKSSIVKLINESIMPQLSKDTLFKLRNKTYSFGEEFVELQGDFSTFAEEAMDCNRVINNAIAINKKVDITSNSNKDAFTLASMIESQYPDMEKKLLYSITLESLRYLLDTDEEAQLLQEVTDFYIAGTDITNEDINLVVTNLNLYSKEAKKPILKMFKEEEENSLTKETITDVINSAKAKKEIKVEKLKGMMAKIYGKPQSEVLNDMPNILAFIRKFFIIMLPAMINPIFGLITGIADFFIESKCAKPAADRHIKQLTAEIAKAKVDIKNNPDKSDQLKGYINTLEKNVDKMTRYKRGLEREEFEESFYQELMKSMSLEEQMAMIIAIEENIDDLALNEQVVMAEATTIDLDDPEDERKAELKKMKKEQKAQYKAAKQQATAKDDKKESKYAKAIPIKGKEEDGKDEKVSKSTTDNSNERDEVDKNTEQPDTKISKPITAGNQNLRGMPAIMNAMKMTGNVLKKQADKLSNSEKVLSSRIDAAADGILDGIERTMTDGKREQIIKGKMLPPLSSMIKKAAVVGGAYMVNPVLATIGTIGSFAINKNLTMKEKQYVLDEIEIEMKICKEKINQARMTNDTETLEGLYRIERALEREHQRIKLNLRSRYGAKAIDVVRR